MAEGGVDEVTQRQIVHDCFNGNIERKCSTCPCHHSRPGGICCFGNPEEYDDESDDCQKCVFQEDCVKDVIEEQAEAQYAHRMATGWRPPSQRVSVNYKSPSPSRFSSPSSTSSNPRLVQIGGLRKEQERRSSVISPTKVSQEEVQGTMWSRFGKDVVWGALQGACEMAAEFFRNYRWK